MKSFKFVQVLVFAIMLVFVSACTPEQIMPPERESGLTLIQ